MNWNPPAFTDFAAKLQSNPKGANQDLDNTVQRLSQQVSEALGVTTGQANGTANVTGALTINTGLSSVTNVVASLQSTTALNEWVTVAISQASGQIKLLVWKPTASNDNTPIASTTKRVVRWYAFGTQ